ncbi:MULTISPECIES: hypothetical protein [unclassified Microbacterium]|uniref:hypothetical protein n=1 Tax=unclassified Microbacterium TaxID=2609290 RepID=UPI003018D376
MSYHLSATLAEGRPHVLVSLTAISVDGSLEANTLDEARQLRRGLGQAFHEVTQAIRAEKRRLRAEARAARARRRQDTRDLARVSAYATGAARG